MCVFVCLCVCVCVCVCGMCSAWVGQWAGVLRVCMAGQWGLITPLPRGEEFVGGPRFMVAKGEHTVQKGHNFVTVMNPTKTMIRVRRGQEVGLFHKDNPDAYRHLPWHIDMDGMGVTDGDGRCPGKTAPPVGSNDVSKSGPTEEKLEALRQAVLRAPKRPRTGTVTGKRAPAGREGKWEANWEAVGTGTCEQEGQEPRVRPQF